MSRKSVQSYRLGIAMSGENRISTSPEGEVVRKDLLIETP